MNEKDHSNQQTLKKITGCEMSEALLDKNMKLFHSGARERIEGLSRRYTRSMSRLTESRICSVAAVAGYSLLYH